MKKGYEILSIDEGQLIAVVDDGGVGRAVSNGNVTHYVDSRSLTEYLNENWGAEAKEEKIRLAEEGKIFQRTLPGKGTFTFSPMEAGKIPLSLFIDGSEESIASGGGGLIITGGLQKNMGSRQIHLNSIKR